MSKINVNGKEIAVVNIENYDYISLTDMVRVILKTVLLLLSNGLEIKILLSF